MTDPEPGRIEELVAKLTLNEKVRLLTGRDAWSLHALPKIGLRSIVMSDGPAGVRGEVWDERSPSVNFPSPTAMAASWDPGLLRRIGQELGREARRKNVDVVLAPTINLHRTPYGGRHFEAFSEDPLLTGILATEYVAGVQAWGVGATVKHYVANDSETERFTVDVRVSERALREVYLLAFEAPVTRGGAWVVMSAYNSINGVTASENPLLTEPLDGEWAFDGVVVSDWTAVRSVESARHPQDLVMPGPHGPWGSALVDAVTSGDIPEATIDRKVARLLRLAWRVGALDGFASPELPEIGDVSISRATAREAAAMGAVLLRNEGLLPLSAPRRIALIGEGARWTRNQGGGSATVIPTSVRSPLEGARARWPEAQVAWALGAVVQTGIADLEPGTFTAGGEAGMLVRYLDTDERELGREIRTVSGIVSFDGLSLGARSAIVEMSLRLRPDEVRPTVPFAVAGASDWEVWADGRLAGHGALRTHEGDDPATTVLTPPWQALPLPMSGDSVDITVRFRPVAGEIPDALALRVGHPPREVHAVEAIAEAVSVAADADIAIVVVSTSPEVESEGFDRADLRLPGHQDELVRAVAAANPNTVVVVNSGAPVLMPWADDVAAIVAVWFPGQEAGDAIADVLSGDVEPGGRLPVTWPAHEEDVPVRNVTPAAGRLVYEEDIHIGYRAWLRAGAEPAFPFGHGLGYTTWSMDNLRVLVDRDGFVVEVPATNTGARGGRSVIQVYAERASESSVDRPTRWLVGFAPVVGDPGNTQTASMQVPWSRLAHWDDGWTLEPGRFRLRAAWSAADPGITTVIGTPNPSATGAPERWIL
jgi:beta-glucosidase